MIGVIDPHTKEVGEWTNTRQFNLMFKTHIGPVSDSSSIAYLRPETAQGIFVNYLNVQSTSRQKITLWYWSNRQEQENLNKWKLNSFVNKKMKINGLITG